MTTMKRTTAFTTMMRRHSTTMPVTISLWSMTRLNDKEQQQPPHPPPRRMGLEGILHNPNAFVLEGAIPVDACKRILNACKYDHGLVFFQSLDTPSVDNHQIFSISYYKNLRMLILVVLPYSYCNTK